MARGRADTFLTEYLRNDAFFKTYDVNTIRDPADPKFVRRVKDEMARIRASLAGLDPASRDLDMTVATIGTPSQPGGASGTAQPG